MIETILNHLILCIKTNAFNALPLSLTSFYQMSSVCIRGCVCMSVCFLHSIRLFYYVRCCLVLCFAALHSAMLCLCTLALFLRYCFHSSNGHLFISVRPKNHSLLFNYPDSCYGLSILFHQRR